jgi:transcriptional regulator with XRE-family HTH domain
MSQETLGERLQKVRQRAGLSQSDLAEAADTPIGTIRNWEQGRRVPLFDAVIRVAQALGVSIDELAAEGIGPNPAMARGRPKKEPTAEKPERPRGRPRKTG